MAQNKKLDLSEFDSPSDPYDLSEFDSTPTPTGLPSINKSTDVQPDQDSIFSKLADSAIRNIPFLGNVQGLEAAPPEARNLTADVAAQEAGSLPGQAITAAGIATGQPAIVAGGIGLQSVGAGLASATQGLISDIADSPERTRKAVAILFDPAKPYYQGLIDEFKTNPDNAIAFAKEELAKSGERFTAGAIGQLAGVFMQSVMSSVSKIPGAINIASKAIPGAVEEAQQFNTELNPAQRSSSRLADVLDKTARHSVLGADTMRAADARQIASLNTAKDNVLTDLAGGISENIPRSEIGQRLTETHELGAAIQQEYAKHIYNQLDKEISGVSTLIDTPRPSIGSTEYVPYQVRSEGVGNYPGQRPDIIAGKTTLPGIGVPTEPLKEAVRNLSIVDKSGRAYRLSQNILSEGRYLPFTEFRALKSDLAALARESNDPQMARIAKHLNKTVFETMAKSAKDAGPDIYNMWRNADKFVEEGAGTFNNDLVARMFVQDRKLPADIGKAVYRNGNVDQVDQLGKIIDRTVEFTNNPKYKAVYETARANNPSLPELVPASKEELWSITRRGYLQDLFSDYAVSTPGEKNPNTINFNGLNAELEHANTNETLKKMFPSQKIEVLKSFARTGVRAMKNASEYTRQGLGVIEHLTNQTIGTVAPWLLNDRTGSNLLIGGLDSLARATSKASPYFTKGADLLTKAGVHYLLNEEENGK